MPVYNINAKRLKAIVEAPKGALITVYTLQHPNAFKQALKIGYLTGRCDKSCHDLYESYTWMRQQMSERLTNFTGDYPVWCHLGVVQPKQNLFRIKARIPRERILLSNYRQWEEILNFWPVTENKEEYDALESLFPVGGFEFLKDVPELITDSWNKIFNIKYESIGREQDEEGYSWYRAGQVQACVDRIYISDIVDVTVKYGPDQFKQLGD